MRLRSSFSALVAGISLLGATGTSVLAQGTMGSVSGVVTSSASNVPLPDTRVAVAGTTVFSITAGRGEYRLTNVPAGPVTITFTRIGFKQERVRVTIVGGNNTVHNQALQESVANLTEVVVTGTAGNQERRAQAASIASVNASDIVASAPIASVQELLTARTPGISVNKASGSAGTSSQIKIRGSSSISLSNTPLIFVDGVRVAESNAINILNQTADRLNDINPDDIESIEVVKGPAAATLYGADASVGVIQIITKRGKIGGQKFMQTVKYEYGSVDPSWTPPSNYANCTAAGILATSFNPLCRGNALGALVSDNPLVRTGAFRNGLDRNAGWSGRGGGQAFSYFLSLGYDNTLGTLPNNGFLRYTTRTNLTFQPAPEWTIDFSGNFIQSNTTLPDNDNNIYGFLGGGLLGSPNTRNDGGVPGGPPPVPGTADGWFGQNRFVAAISAIQNVIETHRNLYSMAINYSPRSWFTNRVTIGADMLRDEVTRFFPKNALSNYAAALNGGQNAQTRVGFERFTLDYLGNVRSTWLADQAIETNLSFGVQTIASRQETLGATGVGFVVNSNNTVTAGASTSGTQTYAEQDQVGFLGQLQFGWKNKLFIQAAARSDRFSSFGRPDDAFFLPKYGISYVLSEEKWMRIPTVSQMRLRAAYGETGRSPGAGAALQTLTAAPYAISNTAQAAGAVPLNPGNSNLKAERGTEVEFGLDLSMFRDRVNFELTYFDKVTKDLLLAVPLPPSLGFRTNPFRNIGEVENSGVEFGVNAKVLTMRNFAWDVRFAMNTLRNNLNTLGGPVASGGVAPYFVGFTGRIMVNEQLGAPVSKRIMSIDTITSIVNVDSAFTARGNILPTFEASLSNSFTIAKYVRLTAAVDTKRDFSVYNLTDYFRETQIVVSNKRLDPTALSKYERLRRYGNQTGGGAPAFVQLGGTPETVGNVNEAYIRPGDFLRFRELALTVSLPATFASTLHLGGGSVTLAMQNVALWTNYDGVDPEVLTNAANQFDRAEFLTVPTPKRTVIKVNFSF